MYYDVTMSSCRFYYKQKPTLQAARTWGQGQHKQKSSMWSALMANLMQQCLYSVFQNYNPLSLKHHTTTVTLRIVHERKVVPGDCSGCAWLQGQALLKIPTSPSPGLAEFHPHPTLWAANIASLAVLLPWHGIIYASASGVVKNLSVRISSSGVSS